MQEVAFLYDRHGNPHSVAVAPTKSELLDYVYDWPGFELEQSTVFLWTDKDYTAKHAR